MDKWSYAFSFIFSQILSISFKLDSSIVLPCDSNSCSTFLNLLTKDIQAPPVKQITLIGASIREIGDMSYAIADGTGEVVTFPVTFSYHYYEDFS